MSFLNNPPRNAELDTIKAAAEAQMRAWESKWSAYERAEAEEAERQAAAEKAREEREDAELQARRTEIRARFLREHPTLTDADFATYWRRIKADELERARTERKEREVNRARATYRSYL